jgi:hypothetical protein
MASPAIVILAHDRPGDLRRTLESVFAQKHVEKFRVHVSCDNPGGFGQIKDVASQFDVPVWEQNPSQGLAPPTVTFAERCFHLRVSLIGTL